MDAKPRCKATTKAGTDCKAAPLTDSDFCLAHSDEETRISMGFVGENGGRPRKPRTSEIYAEVAEEMREQIRTVLMDGLTAERAVVVGNGEFASLETFPDHPHRLKTAAEIADRTDGKPRQSVEMSGPEGGPIVTNVIADPKLAAEARDVLRRAAASSGD